MKSLEREIDLPYAGAMTNETKRRDRKNRGGGALRLQKQQKRRRGVVYKRVTGTMEKGKIALPICKPSTDNFQWKGTQNDRNVDCSTERQHPPE